MRVTASDRTDTVVLIEPINKASQSDVKVANKTKVDFAGGQLSVKTTVSGDKNGSVVITIDLPAGSSLVAYLAHSSVHADGSVHNSVPSQENPDTSDNKVTVHARTRYGDIIIQRAAN